MQACRDGACGGRTATPPEDQLSDGESWPDLPATTPPSLRVLETLENAAAAEGLLVRYSDTAGRPSLVTVCPLGTDRPEGYPRWILTLKAGLGHSCRASFLAYYLGSLWASEDPDPDALENPIAEGVALPLLAALYAQAIQDLPRFPAVGPPPPA